METYFGIEIECLLMADDRTTMSRINQLYTSRTIYDNIADILELFRKDPQFVIMINGTIAEYGDKWYIPYNDKLDINITEPNKDNYWYIYELISSLYIIYKLSRVDIRFIPSIYPQGIKPGICLYPSGDKFEFEGCNMDDRWAYTIDMSVTDISELYKRVYRDDGGKIRYYTHKPVLQYNEIVTNIVNLRDIRKFREELKRLYNNRALQFYFNDSTSMHLHLSKWRNGANIYRNNPRILYNTMRGWLHFEFVFYSLVAPWRFGNTFCYPVNMSRFNMHNRAYRGNVPLTKIYSRKFLYDLYTLSYDDFILKNSAKKDKLEMIIDWFSQSFNMVKYKYDIISEKKTMMTYVDKRGNKHKIPGPIRRVYKYSDNGNKIEKVNYIGSRYRAINLNNLLPDRYGTIEFRLRHGSTDAEECAQFVRLCSRFLDYFTSAGDRVEYDINAILDYNLRTFALCKFPENRIFSHEEYNKFERYDFTLAKDNREIFELLFSEIIRDPILYRYYRKKMI